jgi:hypothetical protein
MNRQLLWNRMVTVKLLSGVLAACACFGIVLAQGGQEAKGGGAAASKFIGADKCKNCHRAEASGDQFGSWQKSAHAKAFATLATDKAKEVGKAKGIADPQKSDQCLKCHVTAFGVAADMIKKGFDASHGVQCESCHGPGEQHLKARFAAAAKAGGEEGAVAAYQEIPEGEMIAAVDPATCVACHNPESPTFKPFCIHARAAAISHLDPRHKRESGKLICGCEAKDGCKHKCDDKCGGAAKPN